MSAGFRRVVRARRKMEEVEAWNEAVPPGTPVELTNDLGEKEKTKTRSEAWIIGNTPVVLVEGRNTPVVLVEGRSGGYALERLKVREDVTHPVDARIQQMAPELYEE